jgi:hypothetical protein
LPFLAFFAALGASFACAKATTGSTKNAASAQSVEGLILGALSLEFILSFEL